MASSDRVEVFWSKATSRNVMIVVSVLMISCQVSTLNKKNVGAQITTMSTQATKNQAFDTQAATAVASLSKSETFLLTSDGISAPLRPFPLLSMTTPSSGLPFLGRLDTLFLAN